MPHNGQIIFFNIPSKIQKLLSGAIRRGLQKTRTFLGVDEPIEILLFYNPNDQEKSYLTNGCSLNKQAIFLNINIKLPFSAARILQLESTAVHEYVHCLRAGKKIQTLLDAIINEGVSTFIQTALYAPPDYLDIQGTHIEDIRKWWKWWHQRYLIKSVKEKSSTAFLDNAGTREGGYRLGYFIASSYFDAKKITPKQLFESSFADIKKFAATLFC